MDWVGVGLGDVIATEGDCKEGEINIAEMLDVFTHFGSPEAYAPLVMSIKAQSDALEGKWQRQLEPFWSGCLELKALGNQAKTLTAKMLADHGAASADVKAPKGFFEGLLDNLQTAEGLAIAGGVCLALWLGYEHLRGGKR